MATKKKQKETKPTESEVESEKIKAMLAMGVKAKARFYQEYLVRVSKGERLTVAEKRLMEQIGDQLTEKVTGKDEPVTVEPCFKGRNEVHRHLLALGYKVSKTKIYQDEKKGILRMNTDGKIPHSAVRAYVDDPRSGLGIGVYESDEKVKDITLKIKEKEFEKLCEQVSMARFQRERAEGLHIKISEYEAEIASRAAVFEAMLRQSNESVTDRIIIAAGIKQAHRQLLIDMLNEALMDALAAYVAQDEIIGEVMGSE